MRVESISKKISCVVVKTNFLNSAGDFYKPLECFQTNKAIAQINIKGAFSEVLHEGAVKSRFLDCLA